MLLEMYINIHFSKARNTVIKTLSSCQYCSAYVAALPAHIILPFLSLLYIFIIIIV